MWLGRPFKTNHHRQQTLKNNLVEFLEHRNNIAILNTNERVRLADTRCHTSKLSDAECRARLKESKGTSLKYITTETLACWNIDRWVCFIYCLINGLQCFIPVSTWYNTVMTEFANGAERSFNIEDNITTERMLLCQKTKLNSGRVSGQVNSNFCQQLKLLEWEIVAF